MQHLLDNTSPVGYSSNGYVNEHNKRQRADSILSVDAGPSDNAPKYVRTELTLNRGRADHMVSLGLARPVLAAVREKLVSLLAADCGSIADGAGQSVIVGNRSASIVSSQLTRLLYERDTDPPVGPALNVCIRID